MLDCQDCLQSYGVRQTYSLMAGDHNEYIEKTDFELLTLLEHWRNEDEKICLFCGSSNVEIHKDKMSNCKPCDFERLDERYKTDNEFIFMLNIDKRGEEITMSTGGSSKFHPVFLNDAINKVIVSIKDRPDHHFHSQDKGRFFICVSGRFDLFSDQSFVRLERFRNSGLTRNELLNAIKPLTQQLGF